MQIRTISVCLFWLSFALQVLSFKVKEKDVKGRTFVYWTDQATIC